MELKLVNLTKEFTKRGKTKVKTPDDVVVAVDHINIDVPDGKLIGLLGPSGCGKSTTLYMIAGLHRPTDGKIYFGEKDVTDLPPEARGIGIVFQNYALYPHLTVEENIMFPLLSRHEKKAEARKKAYEMAKLVDIDKLMDRTPSQLSGGQQQRVAIARALVKMPDVLLLDEPLSNLDARLRLQTREEIKRIQRTTGITTVFVTHDQEEAMSISDQIVVMKLGVVQQIGAPQDVYDEPANEFVAKFLGTPPISIVEAHFTDDGLMFGNQLFKEDLGISSEDMKKYEDEYQENVRKADEKYQQEVKDATQKVTLEYNALKEIENTQRQKAEAKGKEINPKYVVDYELNDAITNAVSDIKKDNVSNIHIGIRPEFFNVCSDGKYELYIEFVEYIGRDKTIIFKLPGIENQTFKAVVPSSVLVEPDKTYKFNLSKFFVFDKDGRRIK